MLSVPTDMRKTVETKPPSTEPHSAKPFLKWVGGKRQLLDEISKNMPESFGQYYEPFVGGGAVFFKLIPFNKRSNLFDLNKNLNLALLNRKENQQLQNSSLDKKIEDIYSSNEFRENSEILVGMQEKFRTDPEGAVIERGKYLGKIAFKRLSLNK